MRGLRVLVGTIYSVRTSSHFQKNTLVTSNISQRSDRPNLLNALILRCPTDLRLEHHSPVLDNMGQTTFPSKTASLQIVQQSKEAKSKTNKVMTV